MKALFEVGMLAIGTFVTLAFGLVLRCGDMMAPGWRSLLIGGMFFILAALWLLSGRPSTSLPPKTG